MPSQNILSISVGNNINMLPYKTSVLQKKWLNRSLVLSKSSPSFLAVVLAILLNKTETGSVIICEVRHDQV